MVLSDGCECTMLPASPKSTRMSGFSMGLNSCARAVPREVLVICTARKTAQERVRASNVNVARPGLRKRPRTPNQVVCGTQRSRYPQAYLCLPVPAWTPYADMASRTFMRVTVHKGHRAESCGISRPTAMLEIGTQGENWNGPASS